MTGYFENVKEAIPEAFEPINPCRQMETRPCVDLTEDVSKRFRKEPCPPGKCRRHPGRDLA